jgi:hypothetical protein
MRAASGGGALGSKDRAVTSRRVRGHGADPIRVGEHEPVLIRIVVHSTAADGARKIEQSELVERDVGFHAGRWL